MKNVILHILCEGQTEERFIKEVLSPYLAEYGIYSKPILLTTSRKKNAKGGMISYIQAKTDLERLYKQYPDNNYEKHLFTTMFDYYALPIDFPFFQESKNVQDPFAKVAMLEEKFKEDSGSQRLIPYLQIHEFEALLFSDITNLIHEYPSAQKEIEKLKADTSGLNPELINNNPDTAPSKRIIKALMGKYRYNKVRSGAAVTALIGIDKILSCCAHFRNWIESIKQAY